MTRACPAPWTPSLRTRISTVALLTLALLLETGASARSRRVSRSRRSAKAHAPVFQAGTATHALKPLGTIGMSKRRAAGVERRLAKHLSAVPGVKLAPARPIRRFLRSRRGAPMAVCEADLECLYDLGKALGVPYLVAGDLSGLGKGYVLFLRLVDARSRRVVRKISVVYGGQVGKEDRVLREAAFRLLAPARYVGRVRLEVDVPGAAVYWNGRLLGKSPLGEQEVGAGTHALRVTHPAYHDFVRFIRVPFEQTVSVKVVLKRFPIISEELRATRRAAAPPPPAGSGPRDVRYRPLPWYKRWWFVTGVGVVLLAATVTTVALVRKAHLDRDGSVVLTPPGEAQALPVLVRFR